MAVAALKADLADHQTDDFLDVAASVRGRRWRARAGDADAVRRIAQSCGLPELVARVLDARGVLLGEVPGYLNPTLKEYLPDPSTLQDMDRAAERIADAVAAGEKIAVFGDYDVDGATSSALLVRLFRAYGLKIDVYIPDRIEEGYGPNGPAMRALRDRGAALVITVDCGVTAFDALNVAKDAGLDVIVADHHQADDALPPAHAVVNPNRRDDTSDLGYLAAVGVTFLLAVAVNRCLRGRGWFSQTGIAEPDLRRWLDLVALGTVCDVVPLVKLNRAFVVQGLKTLAGRSNQGLNALAGVAAMNEAPDSYHLGFILGPRVNAGGRVGQSDLGVRLLSTEDEGQAVAIAQELDGLNRERREIEAAVLDSAMAQGEKALGDRPDKPIIFVQGADWHPGVIGIVASRLKDRFERPTLVLSITDGIAKGSGRSMTGVDFGAAVLAASEAGLLINGGGHAMAAGVTVEEAQIEALEDFLSARMAEDVLRARADRALEIDGVVSIAGVKRALFDLVAKAGPYGAGNPEPVFAIPRAQVVWADIVGGAHVRCTLSTPEGAQVKGIAFRAADQPLGEALLNARGAALHIAGRLRADNWKGRNDVQFQIEDAAVLIG